MLEKYKKNRTSIYCPMYSYFFEKLNTYNKCIDYITNNIIREHITMHLAFCKRANEKQCNGVF